MVSSTSHSPRYQKAALLQIPQTIYRQFYYKSHRTPTVHFDYASRYDTNGSLRRRIPNRDLHRTTPAGISDTTRPSTGHVRTLRPSTGHFYYIFRINRALARRQQALQMPHDTSRYRYKYPECALTAHRTCKSKSTGRGSSLSCSLTRCFMTIIWREESFTFRARFSPMALKPGLALLCHQLALWRLHSEKEMRRRRRRRRRRGRRGNKQRGLAKPCQEMYETEKEKEKKQRSNGSKQWDLVNCGVRGVVSYRASR